MIEKVNHVAIVVPDLMRAKSVYEGALGARVSAVKALPEHETQIDTAMQLERHSLPREKKELLKTGED